MRIFLDTNILLDIVEQRQPHYADSFAVLERCEAQAHEVFMAWHTLSNAFYIYCKKVGKAAAEQAPHDALQVITIAAVNHTHALRAFTLCFTDLEDAMQAVAAEACAADYIVTRNDADFASSPIPVLTPAQFTALHPAN